MRTIPTLTVALTLLLSARPAPAARPNILFAMGDNWAYPHAGALGDPVVRTPTFDRVAREGMLLTQAYCPVPSCSPTRSCILTGRPAHQLEDAASLWSAFPSKFRVFTGALRDAGYEVGFTQKGWSPGNYKDFGWTENPVGPQFKDFAAFMAQRHSDQPFFFWLGPFNPATHTWKAGAGAASGLDPRKVVVPPCLPDVEEVRLNILDYYESVERMDTTIGQAVALLEQLGLMDNTVIVYTGDNGWQFPRGLANCYDTGCRVPMAVRWPGHVAPGSRSDAFVSLTDLAPTFLQLAGLQPWKEMTGTSFVDLVTAAPGSENGRGQVFLERERHANVRRGDLSYPIRAIRTHEYLYLRNLRPDRWPAGDPEVYFAVGDYGDVDPSAAKDYILAHAGEPGMKRFYDLNFAKRPAEELYDLKKDPGQVNNVAADAAYAAAKTQLGRRLDEWMKQTADPRVDPAYDAWDKYIYYNFRKFDPQKEAAKKKAAKK